MYTESARREIETLQNDLQSFRVRAARVSYAMADEFRARVIRNIDNMFGDRAKNASKAEVKRLSARKLGASGNLRNSVALSSNGSNFRVTVGNEQVPYAAIHEYGGTIFPRRVKYLTIPVSFTSGGRLDFFNEITSGHRAREFDLFKLGRFLYFKKDVKQAKRRGYAGTPAYFLAKKAQIPPRPYFQPAIDELSKDEKFMREQLELAGLDPNKWEVTFS